MRKISIVLICLAVELIGMSVASANLFKGEKSKDYKLRLEQVQNIILDYENYCNKGCKYKLNGVKQLKIVERVSPTLFYIWMDVRNVKNFQYFSKVEVIAVKNKIVRAQNALQSERAEEGIHDLQKEGLIGDEKAEEQKELENDFLNSENSEDGGKLEIITTYPSAEEVKYLTQKYRLAHQTPFISADSKWTLEEKLDASGNFVSTNVNYLGQFDSSMGSIFNSIIQKNINASVEELYKALDQNILFTVGR